MHNGTYFKPSPAYYFQRLTEILKTLLIVFILTFVISSIYLLHKNILFESVKISLNYFRAKFYVAIGFESFSVPIFDIPRIDAPKAIWVVNNAQVIKIYGYLKDAIMSSITTGLTWVMVVVLGLIGLFLIKAWWKYKKKAILSSKLVKNSLFKIHDKIGDLINYTPPHLIKFAHQQSQYSFPKPEENKAIVVKQQKLSEPKKQSAESKPKISKPKTSESKKLNNNLTGNIY